MSHEEGDEEAFRAQIAEQEAFEARFPPEAFAGVAEAFGLPPEPEILSGLRRCLVYPFYFFFLNCPGEQPSSRERMRRLRERRKAAATLLRSLQLGGPLVSIGTEL